jgi:heme-degrading monooxygenase HmoA
MEAPHGGCNDLPDIEPTEKGWAVITHCALFSFQDGTSEEDVRRLSDALSHLPDLIPEIKGFRHGTGANLPTTTSDYGVVVEFESLDDYKVYASHPEHLKAIEQYLKPILKERSAIQFEH